MRKKIYAVLLGLSIPFLAVAGLESITYISDLVVTNPLSTDPAHQGDDHLRGIKTAVKNTFPNINAAITLTDENINDAALKSASNTFTPLQIIAGNTSAKLQLNAGDSTGDNFIQGRSFDGTTLRWYLGNGGASDNNVQLHNYVSGANVDLSTTGGGLVLINSQTIWHSGNDGAGTSLDADLLDGNSSASFYNSSNQNAGTLATARLPTDVVKAATASMRIAAAEINGTGAACTLEENYGMTSCSRSGVGQYLVDITAAGFTVDPVCNANSSNQLEIAIALDTNLSTAVGIRLHDFAGNQIEGSFHVICVGP